MLADGQIWEFRAEQFLLRQGLVLITRNFSSRSGEIDLIMRDDTHIAFVEVRFRRNVRFGGAIRSITPTKQRKLIKFNHLVANCLILHNVQSMSRILHDLAEEGHDVGDDILASLSPYGTEHVNRFGKHILDMDRKPTALDYEWRREAPLEPEFVG